MSMRSTKERYARLFRNGRNQAIRIPREFELKGSEAIIRNMGHQLIIEERQTLNLVELLDTLEPMNGGLSELESDLLPLDDISSLR